MYLAGEGFSDWAVRTFGHLPVETLAADVQRRRGDGQRTGGIVNAWKVCPPGAPPPSSAAPSPRARASDSMILSAPISPQLRDDWMRRFRQAEPAERPAVLARFQAEVLANQQGPP